MTHLGTSVDTKAERETRPLGRINTDGVEHGWVDHAAPTKFNPAGLRTCSTSLTSTDSAGDFKLCGRFRKGEVGGSESRVNIGTEVRSRKGFDDAGEVAKGDALINHEALYLVEDGQVARIRGIESIAAAGYRHVQG